MVGSPSFVMNSQTRPMHGPAIKLLNNLLKQALVGSPSFFMNSQTRPTHGPAIKLPNNLLKQALVGSPFSGMNIVCVDLFVCNSISHSQTQFVRHDTFIKPAMIVLTLSPPLTIIAISCLVCLCTFVGLNKNNMCGSGYTLKKIV